MVVVDEDEKDDKIEDIMESVTYRIWDVKM